MPIYEYECAKCASRFEVKRGFHEEGGDCCPHCGGKGCQIFSPSPIIFKGSGFYVTDHRKKDDKATDREQPVKSESEKSTGKTVAGKTGTKPAPDKPSAKTEPVKPNAKSDTDKS
jgi:putative FmdB family regulatory protein